MAGGSSAGFSHSLSKKILITGAGGHAGSVLCADLSDDYDVLASGRAASGLRVLDVCDLDSWRALQPELDQGLFALIHCVGPFVHQPIDTCEPETWRELIAGNLDSAFYAYHFCRRGLRKSRGRIIFFGLAGVQAQRPEKNQAAYAAAKNGLLSLSSSIAATEAGYGLTCNVIAPGLLHNETREEVRRFSVPAGRQAAPLELCSLVRYLLSEQAQQVTGSVMNLSGGWRL
jgi:NAD(P)-dependent dehydrogenase (short-subunit alcohol dehydrogenase family)